MKHLFGPVPSRRLGMSLGIDLVPHKICTFNCIYCECGKTTDLTVERKEYISYDEVIAELKDYFSSNPDPDYFTFSGSGEPTLNSRIGDIIRFIKREKPSVPVAVLTNGSLLCEPDVRKELLNADVVIPSLDAVLPEAFKKINDPHSSITIDEYVHGLVEFRKMFKGEIWLEIFILPGYNDSSEDLKQLKNILKEIKADKIQINTLDRPGLISTLKPAERADLEKLVDFLDVSNIEIVSSASGRNKSETKVEDVGQAILNTISRRPCTVEDLSRLFNFRVTEVNKYIRILEDEDKITRITLPRGIFYKLKK